MSEVTTEAAPTTPSAETGAADLSNMTGAEAKAYIEAQKGKSPDKADKPIAGAPPTKDKVTADTMSEAAQEAIRKYKVKIAGEEREVDEKELLRGYSHQQAANKILQEGKAAKKQAEEFIMMMKDPQKFYEVAQQLGHEPRTLAEKYLAAQLEDELLDPRDRKIKEYERKLAETEARERAEQETKENQVREALKAKYAKDYSDQFVGALQESGLPPTKPMVAEMAKYIARSAKMGFEMTAQEAARLVKEDVQNLHQRLVGEADGDSLIQLLGESVANKIRKYDMGKVKSPEAFLKTPHEQNPKRERKERNPSKRMTPQEWRKFNRGI